MPNDDPSQPLDYESPGAREPSFNNLQTVGMALFLAALFMLFVSGLIGYVWIRTRNVASLPLGSIHLPAELWLSTLLVIGVSIALARAGKSIAAGRVRSFRNALTAALALAAGFLTVQTPALITLLSEHQRFKTGGTHLYGFVFFLILLHAMHVVGGMIALAWVTAKAHRGGYERSGRGAIRNTALYWHFLDVVWIVMFGLLLILR